MYQLDYILKHFYSLHPKAQGVPIHYSDSEDIIHRSKVRINKYQGSFFEKKRPRPQHVIWRTWKDEKIPFFFDEDKPEDIITYTEDRQAIINYDIIASAFYLLSGWQEYYGIERDKFGRYTYKASVQAKYNFITKPVVNYYFDILKEAVEKVHAMSLDYNIWGDAAFGTCLTCDVDRLSTAWRAAGKQYFKAGRIPNTLHLLLKKALGKDAWNNIPEVLELANKFEAKSTLFFLPSDQRYNGYPNADYDLSKPKYQKLISELLGTQHEVGLHGSFGTSNDLVQLKADRAKLSVQVRGSRFHYLCYQPEKSVQVLKQSKLDYDTTLGFAEHFGFRNSFAHPFYPFDFAGNKPAPYLELPLLLMDTTLYSINYLHINPVAAFEAVKPIIDETIKFKGLFTFLWHNENFSDYSEYPTPKNEPNWKNVLEQIMAYLKKNNTSFFTCSEASDLYKPQAITA